MDGSIDIYGTSAHLCARIEEVVIDEGVTSIGDWAFYEFSGLTEIKIPDSVTVIGDNVFDSCSDLIVYYSGNALDEYINSHQDVWDSNHITWIKQ